VLDGQFFERIANSFEVLDDEIEALAAQQY
jgi:hypothetical protein